jgi:hypothetical protein
MPTQYKIDAVKLKESLQFKKVADNIPQPCFRLGLFASSGGGKTTIIVNMLTKPHFYRDYFEWVFIWSPTISVDPNWQALKQQLPANRYNRIKVFEEYDEKHLDAIRAEQKKIIKQLPKGKTSPILLIFDDMIDSDIMGSKKFKSLFFRGRHDHISLMLSYQSYKMVQRSLRMNLSDVVVTQVQSNELSKIAEEQCNSLLTAEGFEKMYRDVKAKDKYGFLYRKCGVSAVDQYWNCFDEKITIDTTDAPPPAAPKPPKIAPPAKKPRGKTIREL